MDDRPRPSARQLEYQDWELGLFLHFGIRTFYEGHRDWDGRAMPAAGFAPAALDCGAWARTAREAGVRYAVLTAKHHDGFANWPSRMTGYSVAASPWRGGRGDVVREFTDAFRAEGIAVGLYYSPADASKPRYADPRAYDDYFLAQISEILTGYGRIDVLWFDGCGSEGHRYDWGRICAEIRRMQPEILIFNMGDPDFRWIGNESGVAPGPCWNVADCVDFSVRTDARDDLGARRPRWLPAECDCRMRAANWFYSDADAHTVKPAAELMGLYDLSVGRGANLLINIGPDRRGLLPDPDAAALAGFGRAVRERFAQPLAGLADFAADGAAWTARFGEPPLVGQVVIEEDQREGQLIRACRILAEPAAGAREPVELWRSTFVGHKAIAVFPALRARWVRFEVLASDAPPRLRALAVHGPRA